MLTVSTEFLAAFCGHASALGILFFDNRCECGVEMMSDSSRPLNLSLNILEIEVMRSS